MDDRPTSHDKAKARDLAVGVAAMALAFAALLTIPSQVSSNAYQSFGNIRSPAFFPVIASGLLGVFSTLLVIRSRKMAGTDRKDPGGFLPSRRVVVVAIMFAAAGAAMTVLGFLATAFALIIGLSAAFGARNYATVIALAIAVPAAIHLLFRSVLSVLLPSGILF